MHWARQILNQPPIIIRHVLTRTHRDRRITPPSLSQAGVTSAPSAVTLESSDVDRGEDSSVFAMNIDIHGTPDLARRLPISKAILGEVGAI